MNFFGSAAKESQEAEPMSGNHFRHIDVRPTESFALIRFRQTRLLDELEITGIASELFGLAKTDEPMLAIDFANIEFMSSMMLGKLISLQSRVREMNGILRLCRVHEGIFEVFRLAKLEHYFTISEDFEHLPEKSASQVPEVVTEQTVAVELPSTREILSRLAQVLECAENLKRQVETLAETVQNWSQQCAAGHEPRPVESNNDHSADDAPETPPLDDTAEHKVWKPPQS